MREQVKDEGKGGWWLCQTTRRISEKSNMVRAECIQRCKSCMAKPVPLKKMPLKKLQESFEDV
jgi:hypothetical protein